MSSLIDAPVRYDLAESTSPPLRLGEVVDPVSLAGLSLDYGTSPGDAELRAAIAADAGVLPDQVLVTVGAAGAMFLLAQDRAPGRVVVVGPCFPPARTVPKGLGSPVDVVPSRFADGYRLPVGAVAERLTTATRLVSLASPQNPAGVRYTDAELAELLAVVAERAAPDAVVLVDETYRAATYGPAPVPPSAAARSPRVVTCSSLSKAHGAPGLRVGWLTTTDPDLYERLRNAKFLRTIACSGIDEHLALGVLRQQRAILAPRAAHLARTLAELTAWVADHPVDLVRPDGGALCCLRLAPEVDVADFHVQLAALDTRVAPGSWFGDEDRVFRLGFGHLPPDDFTEALARLSKALTTATS
ncbi:pyridoxal phosphate-dependent aminotransferase [Actinocatenispora rupis]|uniref:Aminotransferase n=2 Tax=Actinocatenispora rupis TaxID=519421 RepID=A0A8J3NFZ9_9ACTN|nr:aminotransferase [Actinocatenispora rupis]